MSGSPGPGLNQLSERVAGLESGFRGLASQLEGIAKQVSEIGRGRPQNLTAMVTTAAVVLGLLGTLAYAFLTPLAKAQDDTARIIEKITDNYARLELLREDEKKQAEFDRALIDRLDRLGDNKLSKETHAAFEKAVGERFDDEHKFALLLDQKMGERVGELETNVKGRLTWTEGSIGTLSANLVTRAENAAHWDQQTNALASVSAAQAERSTAIVSSLNELRRQFYEAFNSGDGLKDVMARLRGLEEERRNGFEAQPARPAIIAPGPPGK